MTNIVEENGFRPDDKEIGVDDEVVSLVADWELFLANLSPEHDVTTLTIISHQDADSVVMDEGVSMFLWLIGAKEDIDESYFETVTPQFHSSPQVMVQDRVLARGYDDKGATLWTLFSQLSIHGKDATELILLKPGGLNMEDPEKIERPT